MQILQSKGTVIFTAILITLADMQLLLNVMQTSVVTH